MKRSGLCLAATMLLHTGGLSAQSEPVDKNEGGPFVGGQLVLGQGQKAGGDSPGPAWLMLADVGYGIKRDTWNRLELGLELGTGSASFDEKEPQGSKSKVDLDLSMVSLIKAGYGYSLGDHAFGLLRIGVGVSQAERSVGDTRDEATGTAAMIAWDAVFPASSNLDFLFGASFRFFNYNFDDKSFQLNIPSLYGGVRVRL